MFLGVNILSFTIHNRCGRRFINDILIFLCPFERPEGGIKHRFIWLHICFEVSQSNAVCFKAKDKVGILWSRNEQCFSLFFAGLPFNVHADSSSIEITPADRYVAYPGQTVQHHIDVTYTGNSGSTLKLELGTQYLSSVSGNGQELVFDNGETKRFLWTMTIPQATPLWNGHHQCDHHRPFRSIQSKHRVST